MFCTSAFDVFDLILFFFLAPAEQIKRRHFFFFFSTQISSSLFCNSFHNRRLRFSLIFSPTNQDYLRNSFFFFAASSFFQWGTKLGAKDSKTRKRFLRLTSGLSDNDAKKKSEIRIKTWPNFRMVHEIGFIGWKKYQTTPAKLFLPRPIFLISAKVRVSHTGVSEAGWRELQMTPVNTDTFVRAFLSGIEIIVRFKRGCV